MNGANEMIERKDDTMKWLLNRGCALCVTPPTKGARKHCLCDPKAMHNFFTQFKSSTEASSRLLLDWLVARVFSWAPLHRNIPAW